jgi:hypothetical protein
MMAKANDGGGGGDWGPPTPQPSAGPSPVPPPCPSCGTSKNSGGGGWFWHALGVIGHAIGSAARAVGKAALGAAIKVGSVVPDGVSGDKLKAKCEAISGRPCDSHFADPRIPTKKPKPACGSMQETCDNATQYFDDHVRGQAEICVGVCGTLGYQHGNLSLDVGGPGLGGEIAPIYTSVPANEQGPFGGDLCAVGGIGACFGGGPKVDGNGNINGLQYTVGPAVGEEAKIEAEGASSVNILNWNISKGWKGFSTPLFKAPDIGLPSPSSCGFIPWC